MAAPRIAPSVTPPWSAPVQRIAQKIPLAVQCADIIRNGCRTGRWTGHLPPERRLCVELQVGRVTVRAAIAQLGREGLVRISHGKPTRILQSRVHPPSDMPLSVGFVCPRPLHRLRPFVALWIDDLRSQLQDAGVTLHFHEGQKYYDQAPELALKALVRENPHSAWLFYLTNRRMQEWVAGAGIPAIVLGYTYPELGLPCIFADLHSVCRHAANRMLALGHRNILFLKPRNFGPGDWHSEKGFREAFETGPGRDATPSLISPPENVADFVRLIDRIVQGPKPPSAVLIARTPWFFTAYSHLLSSGARIPGDISLVARDDETFFDHLHPMPTRYSFSARAYVRKIVHSVLLQARGHVLVRREMTITPSLVPGGTLGPLSP